MKSITLNIAAAAGLIAPNLVTETYEPVINQKKNEFGRKGVRTRLTKKQKAFDAAKHKRQLKRKQQQHTRAK